MSRAASPRPTSLQMDPNSWRMGLNALQIITYNGYLPLVLSLTCILVVLGLVSLGKFVAKTGKVVLQTFLLRGARLTKFGAGRGAWAAVTGASDGIGAEFAVQLARAGFNVLLVGRSAEKLEVVKERVRGDPKCGDIVTMVLLIDFAVRDEKGVDEAYKRLEEICRDLDVGVLVNNVGKSHVMPTYFVDTPQEEINDILAVNISATLRITKVVLPGMIQRKRGLVLNVGSFAGSIASPMLATYSGSKAFLAMFSAALGEEVEGHGVVVEHLNTYYVVSSMSKVRRPSALIPLTSAYVRAALSKVGLACGASYTGRPNTSTPFWSHSLLDYAMNVIGWKKMYVRYTHVVNKDIRKRAVRKVERLAKQE